MTGDIFVPNGTANVATQGNGTWTTFIQAQDVALSAGGGLTGDGPGGGSGSSPIPGADNLTKTAPSDRDYQHGSASSRR